MDFHTLRGRGKGRVSYPVRRSSHVFNVYEVSGPHEVSQPIEPVSPNDFVARLFVERVVDSKQSIEMDDVIEIGKNQGFIAQFGLELAQELPTQFEGRKVEAPSEWGMMVLIYPRNGDSKSKSALRGCVQPLDRPGQKRSWMLVNAGESSFWSADGRNALKVPTQPDSLESMASWKAGKSNWYWSYMCVDKDQEGEFVYEIHLLPTARWISPVRLEYGTPVVLKRGLLKVVEEKLDASF